MPSLYFSKTTSKHNFRRTINKDRVHIRIPENATLEELGIILKYAGERILSYSNNNLKGTDRSVFKIHKDK